MPRRPPRYTPVTPDRHSVWADGAMRFAEACRFAGLGRERMNELLRTGEVAWGWNGSYRIVSRRSLVEWLGRVEA